MPARVTSELLDYMGGALAALQWFAYYEWRVGPPPDRRGAGVWSGRTSRWTRRCRCGECCRLRARLDLN